MLNFLRNLIWRIKVGPSIRTGRWLCTGKPKYHIGHEFLFFRKLCGDETRAWINKCKHCGLEVICYPTDEPDSYDEEQ